MAKTTSTTIIKTSTTTMKTTTTTTVGAIASTTERNITEFLTNENSTTKTVVYFTTMTPFDQIEIQTTTGGTSATSLLGKYLNNCKAKS